MVKVARGNWSSADGWSVPGAIPSDFCLVKDCDSSIFDCIQKAATAKIAPTRKGTRQPHSFMSAAGRVS